MRCFGCMSQPASSLECRSPKMSLLTTRSIPVVNLSADRSTTTIGAQVGCCVSRPSETSAENTVQAIAEAANHDLNAGLPAAGTPLAPTTLPRFLQGRPDEVLPNGAH